MGKPEKPQRPCPICGKIMEVNILWPLSGPMFDVKLSFECCSEPIVEPIPEELSPYCRG